jgi:hypothetical protein
MDIFLKYYKQECKLVFSPFGFRSIGNNHYRVINDVFQAFYLHRSLSGDHCTIQFGITPLCYGIDQEYRKTTGGIYSPVNFEGWDAWWYYNRKSIESIQSCIQTIIAYTKEKILPLFDAGTDCASAYRVICQIERAAQQMIDDNPSPGGDCGYYMLLKMGEYEKASMYLRHSIACLEYDDPDMLEMDKTPSYYERKQKWLDECQTSLEMLQSGDDKRITAFLEENERKSRVTLGLEKES